MFPLYLVRKNLSTEPSFLWNKPDDISEYNWTRVIKIRPYNTTLTLLGNEGSNLFVFKHPKPSAELFQVLQSNLQKCIRRKEIDKAVATGLCLFNIDLGIGLTRRLTAIMYEDVQPSNKLFIRLVWYMTVLSKHYKITVEELEELLGIIVTMGETETFESFNLNFRSSTKIAEFTFQKYKNLYWALETRKLYGGMKSDVQMFDYHQELMFNRLSGENSSKWENLLDNHPEYQIELSSVDALTKEDIILESIDYHCFKFIPYRIIDKVPGITIDRVCQAIWMCRSRINVRTPLESEKFEDPSDTNKQDYKKIKPFLAQISENLMDNYLSVFIKNAVKTTQCLETL